MPPTMKMRQNMKKSSTKSAETNAKIEKFTDSARAKVASIFMPKKTSVETGIMKMYSKKRKK